MRRVRLTSLVLEFTWTGLASLGGGRSAYLYDRVVGRRGWVTSEEFVQDLTLSQILPGSNVANLAVAIGFRLAGWWGAAWALVAVVLPGAIILLLLAALTFLAVGPLRMSTVLVIATMAVVSGWLHRPRRLDEGIAGADGRRA